MMKCNLFVLLCHPSYLYKAILDRDGRLSVFHSRYEGWGRSVWIKGWCRW